MLEVNALLGHTNTIVGLLLVGLMVYAESGLLLGLLLPGDTLLIIVGVFAAQGDLPLGWSIAVIFIAAILGDNTGYFIGRTTGPHVFKKHTGILFRQEYVDRAEEFYKQHGGKTIIIARFIGYVRTLVPLIAGMAHMRRHKFIIYNILGAGLWTITFVLLGYALGRQVAEQIQRYFIPSVSIGALLILSPAITFFVRRKLKR